MTQILTHTNSKHIHDYTYEPKVEVNNCSLQTDSNFDSAKKLPVTSGKVTEARLFVHKKRKIGYGIHCKEKV